MDIMLTYDNYRLPHPFMYFDSLQYTAYNMDPDQTAPSGAV